MTLQNNDQFVVSRSNIPYSVDSENLVAQLEDSDLMVVCRSGIPYRATGEEIKASLSPTDASPSLTSVTLAEDTPGGSRFDNQSFTSTLSWATKGVPEASLEMQATVTGTLDIAGSTDEIVGIKENTNYSGTCTFTAGGVNPSLPLTNAFTDQDPLVNTEGDTTDAYCIVPIDATIAVGGIEVYFYAVDGEVKLFNQGTEVETVSGGNGWLSNATYSGPIDEIRIGRANRAFEFAGVKVNGELLVDGVGSTLTLASDANLANGVFQAGDAVKQNNSPIVPVSSEITDVSTGADYAATSDMENASNAFDGNTTTTVAGCKGGSFYNTITTTPFTASEIEIKCNAVSGVTDIKVNGGNGYTPIKDGDDPGWFKVTLPQETIVNSLTMAWNQGSSSSIAFSIYGVKADGVLLVDNETLLTLQDASGLSDFEVGDVVQGDGVTYTATDGPAEVVDDPLFQTSSKIATYTAGVANSITFTYPQPADFSTINKWSGGSYSAAVDYTIEFTDQNGNVVSGTGATTSGYAVSTLPVNAPALVKSFKITGDDGYAFLGFYNNSETFVTTGKLASEASITAIDSAAPSITTDGGDWTVGEVVAGPAKLITATFVSADPSVPSMTVSDVVGPWSANTGNFVENTVVNPVIIKPETSAITDVTETVISQASTWDTGVAGYSYSDGDKTVTSLNNGSYPFVCVKDNAGAFVEIGVDETKKFVLSSPTWSALILTSVVSATATNNTDRGGYRSGGTTGWAAYVATDVDLYNNGTLERTIDNFGPATTDPYNLEIEIARDSANQTQTWEITNTASGSTEVQVFADTVGTSIYFGYSSNNTADTVTINAAVSTTLTLTDDTDLAQFATGDAVYAAGVTPASFAPVIYTGNGGTQSFDLGFAPSLVWIKARNRVDPHGLFDIVRGDEKRLQPNTTAEQYDIPNSVTFDSNGFSVGSNNAANRVDDDYVAWCWSAGGTTVTNNDGTIESQVRSNGDFSVVQYTGNLTAGATVGHGLSSKPAFMIFKSQSASDWYVFGDNIDSTYVNGLRLNEADEAVAAGTNLNNTPPTSSVITLGASNQTNISGSGQIAYCWAESPSQSFGSYTGTEAEQPIDLGFAAAFVLIKATGVSEQWYVYDTARQTSSTYPMLNPNLSDAEATTSSRAVKLTSSGFTLVGTDTAINGLGRNYIYAAFASSGGPSGVVGEITGLDMTLSESTGTWEVGQTVTMDEKPAIETTANLIFDSTGAVTGLSTQPVAGQLMSDKDTPTLTFGDGAGTGETWDEELPEGTHLQTSFVATNVEGTSSATSNEITP